MARTKKKILKIFAWIVLAFLLLITGAGIFVFFKAENYINKNLSEIVAKSSNQLYQLSFDKIDIELFPLSVIVSEIQLSPDENLSTKILKESADKVVYSFESKKLEIRGISIKSILRNKRFHTNKIIIADPLLEIRGDELILKDSVQTADKILYEIRPLFQKYVKDIQVDEIDFVNAHYQFFNTPGDSSVVSNAKHISVGIKNFRTDSTMIFHNSKLFDTDDILVQMNDFRFNFGDSLHVLQIDTLEYSLLSSDISARSFHLTYLDKNSEKSLYDVFVPRMYMKSDIVSRLTVKDSIDVEFLKFENPRIRFYQKENSQKLQIEDISNFDFYSLIDNQFTKVVVDSFYLSNADLEIYRQPDIINYQQKFESLEINLNGFELDSLSSKNPEKLLYADDLEMEVSGYHLKLEDNAHDFSAGSMFFSTYSNTLGVKEINISPADTTKKHPRIHVNIDCEAIEVSDVDLKKLYHTRTLPTREILVTKPNVNLQVHADAEKIKKTKETGLLFELITAYLRGVYSDLVTVKQGKLNIQNLTESNVKGYFETGFTFNLTGFSLDSTSIEQTDKFFYATNFDLEFSDYQMRLVDDLHKINVDQISILSFERKVEIQNLQLQPVIENADETTMSRFSRSELYNIKVPRIILWGINLRNAFFNNKLNISRFQILNPEIYFENFGALRQSQEKKEFSEFSQLVFNYLADINISQIDIPNGEFAWINHTKKGKTTSFDNEFSASLENFRLNENELNKKRLLFSDNFDISVKDQLFHLSDSVHILQAGEINLSTAKSTIKINNALLYPVITSEKYKQLPTTFQVSIPNFEISNFDFLKAYYSKELNFNKLELNKPKFQVYNRAGKTKSLDLSKYKFPLPSFIEALQLGELKISGAEVLTYETRGIDQHAKSYFNLDLTIPKISIKNDNKNQLQISTGNLISKISDLKSPLGKTHELGIQQVDYNQKQKTISISGLQVNPFTQSQVENRFSISIPRINFHNFDINKVLEDNTYSFDEIDFVDPNLQIEINDSLKGKNLEKAKTLDLYPYVNSYVDEILVKKLNFENITLDFSWFKKQLFKRDFNLVFHEINIGENQNPENFLHSKEFEILTTGLKTTTKNNLYEFTADSLIYNSHKHNILFKNIQVNPLLSREELSRQKGFQVDFLKAKTDFVEVKGINENLWVKNNILDANAAIVGKTDVEIFRNKRYPFDHNQRPPWPQDLLRNIKQQFVFDSLILKPSTIKYSELMDISDEPGTIKFENLKLRTGKISNQPQIITQQKNLEIVASTKIFEQAEINARFIFDLTSNKYKHSVSGNVGKMPFTAVNPMLEKAAPVSIESGDINRFDFEFNLNDKYAEGELYFGYDNFKINVLELNADGAKKSKLASFWANKMLLNSKNPKGDKFDPVEIYYERDVERSIINYWWKSILTGAKEALGIEKENSKD
ncbi:hypothetical protein GM418_01300 [Maribellus comscasis]|uniref:Uncharacterized protein n=1 Tax=Maribellus comscasis TaxID=2681766 RepID=A0A6I6JQC9_9BACT|nr:hypothetical protein [Maribellus comscasis]QGY42337.1 hypothetical protein GM418_01300 [Maribellus comscasis]